MEPKIQEKVWDPKIESDIRKKWENSKLYEFHADTDGYTIDTPPPYPSGRPWHIGAAAHYAQIDMIARTARMNGKNVYFPMGIDRNGLPVELYTEKKHGIRMRETERGKFLDLCKDALDDLEAEMIQIMKNLGLSCDFDNYYRTDSEEYRALTQSTFIELWKSDSIYLANRPNNYDWVTGTTIADAEIIYEELPTKLVHMKFKVKDGEEVIIASTRPELLCACISTSWFDIGTVTFFPTSSEYLSSSGFTITALHAHRSSGRVLTMMISFPSFTLNFMCTSFVGSSS